MCLVHYFFMRQFENICICKLHSFLLELSFNLIYYECVPNALAKYAFAINWSHLQSCLVYLPKCHWSLIMDNNWQICIQYSWWCLILQQLTLVLNSNGTTLSIHGCIFRRFERSCGQSVHCPAALLPLPHYRFNRASLQRVCHCVSLFASKNSTQDLLFWRLAMSVGFLLLGKAHTCSQVLHPSGPIVNALCWLVVGCSFFYDLDDGQCSCRFLTESSDMFWCVTIVTQYWMLHSNHRHTSNRSIEWDNK